MESFNIWTTGCQMNKADSERLSSGLEQLGLRHINDTKSADIVIANTCVVRQSSEDKASGFIDSFKSYKRANPEKLFAVMGCMVGPDNKNLKERFPHVDLFMRPQQFEPLIENVANRLNMDIESCIKNLTPVRPQISAYVPIIHGCDKFCSFCIIPYRRGREKSRTIEELTRECQLLVDRGVREITLLGQNVDSYGHDFAQKKSLADLLYAINEIPNLLRIRFLTSHPNDMSPDIIEAVDTLPKVCEHFNLPFQAGDDRILEIMRRGYTNDQYRRLVQSIRNQIPNVSITTDLIVGFCSETDAEFTKSYEMVQDLNFDKVHVSPYSTRKGTIADRKLEDNVPQVEKKERVRKIEELQKDVAIRNNQRLLGTTVEVLVETKNKGKWQGRTRTDKLVFFEHHDDFTGQLVNVYISSTGPWSLKGELSNTSNTTASETTFPIVLT